MGAGGSIAGRDDGAGHHRYPHSVGWRAATLSIASLRDLGTGIAIDDLGTGYSTLAYLKNWRVDTLKIDRSFIRDLATDSSDYAIASAIVAMVRHLRIEVVAEGIEAYQQADILRNLGCHQGQGQLYARPMSANNA